MYRYILSVFCLITLTLVAIAQDSQLNSNESSQIVGIRIANTNAKLRLYSPEEFSKMSMVGFNTCVMSVSYASIESDKNAYSYNEQEVNLILQNVKNASKAGLGVYISITTPNVWFALDQEFIGWEDATRRHRFKSTLRWLVTKLQKEPFFKGIDFSKLNTTAIQDNFIKDLEDDLKSMYPDIKIWYPTSDKQDGALKVKPFSFPSTYTLNTLKSSVYPDSSFLVYPSDVQQVMVAKSIPVEYGTRRSTYYETDRIQVLDSNWLSLKPVFQVSNIGSNGKWYLGNININEYLPNGAFNKTLYFVEPLFVGDWTLWSVNGSGRLERLPSFTIDNKNALGVFSTTDSAYVYSNSLRVKPKFGHYYQVNTYLQTYATIPESKALLRIDAEISPSGAKPVPLESNLLAKELKNTLTDVSTIVELKLSDALFKKKRGATMYIKDVTLALKEANVSYIWDGYDTPEFSLDRVIKGDSPLSFR